MRIAIGSDHAGFPLKEAVKAFLTACDRRALRSHLGADVAAGLSILRSAVLTALGPAPKFF